MPAPGFSSSAYAEQALSRMRAKMRVINQALRGVPISASGSILVPASEMTTATAKPSESSCRFVGFLLTSRQE